MSSDNNKRIAKNTILLYLRMLLLMGVSLFSVRLVIDILGIEDYGIYNIVAGIVTIFLFVSSSMASGAQRFFAFEIGREDFVALRRVFSLTILTYLVLALLVLLLSFTLGLWFFNEYLNIPIDRFEEAKIVYFYSAFTLFLNILATPYNAIIIAREKMGIYAGLGLFEAGLKLGLLFIIYVTPGEKLVLYSLSIFIATFLSKSFLIVYSHFRFNECAITFVWDRFKFTSLIAYSGWNMVGSLAGVGRNQGGNILLNIFFGPIINAARGIAYQVYGVFTQLISNVYLATRPQIIKYYAKGNFESMWRLVFTSSKGTFFLLLIVSIPIFLEIEYILTLWLKSFPPMTPVFVRLLVINILLESITNQLVAVLQAANKIKIFQVYASSILLLNIPVSYLLLKMGFNENSPFVVAIILTIIFYIPQLLIVKREAGLSIGRFFYDVVGRILITAIFTLMLPSLLYFSLDEGMVRFILVTLVGVISCFSLVYIIGLNKEERNWIKSLIKNVKR